MGTKSSTRFTRQAATRIQRSRILHISCVFSRVLKFWGLPVQSAHTHMARLVEAFFGALHRWSDAERVCFREGFGVVVLG